MARCLARRCLARGYLATATAQSTRSLTALFLPVRFNFALVLFLVGTQKTSPSLTGSPLTGLSFVRRLDNWQRTMFDADVLRSRDGSL